MMPSISEGTLNASINQLLGTASTVNDAASTINAANESLSFNNLEGILSFIKDFEGHLQNIAASAQSLASISREGGPATAAVAEDQAMNYSPVTPPARVEVVRDIDPDKVYQVLLHALTQIPKELQVSEAIELARNNHDMIINQIVGILPKLYADA